MEIQVGLLIPRSSSYPLLSQNLVKGFKLAFANNGINAQFSVEDVGKGGNVEEVLGKANNLLFNDVQICFAMVGSTCVTELSDVFSQSNVPLFLLDAGANINLKSDLEPLPTTFIQSLEMWQSQYVLGEYAGKHYKKTVSSSCFFESGFRLLSAFAQGYEKSGGEIVGYHSTQQFLEDDFKVNLKKIVNEEKPKAMLCLYNGNDADEFYNKCVVKGYDGGLPILTTLLGLGSGKIELDNITLASSWLAESETIENKEFIESYTAKHKKTPDSFAALAYEAADTVAKCAKQMDDWDSDEIVELLKNTTHKGIRGEFTYTETGENTSFPVYLKLTNGEIEQHTMNNVEEIREKDKEHFSSGWFNPYPCS